MDARTLVVDQPLQRSELETYLHLREVKDMERDRK